MSYARTQIHMHSPSECEMDKEISNEIFVNMQMSCANLNKHIFKRLAHKPVHN